jgi:hypothetical protein
MPLTLAAMNFIYKQVSIYNRKIPLVVIAWFALALIAVIAELAHDSINNYLIFKGVFWHTIDEQHLYTPYPAEYEDMNHYGPLFSLMIAPFAVLPNWLGCTLWALTNAAVLYYAILRLKLTQKNLLIVLAITAIEMMTSIHNVQFNPMVAAWIILAYVLVDEENDFWATLFIAAGFLVKIYGIAALLFFVFSKHKLKFIGSFILWLIVLVCIPMIYSSPAYIITSYQNWYESLVQKNDSNAAGAISDYAGHQDISLMGIIRRITRNAAFPNAYVLLPAAVFIVAPLLRFKQYAAENFRLSYLAIVLHAVVIFSSSAESSTYVIAVIGSALWYLLHYQQYPLWSKVILILLFILTILSATDLVPLYLKDHFIRKYSLKALPCVITWLWLVVDVSRKNFLLPASPKLIA